MNFIRHRALLGTGIFPQATYGGKTCGYYPQMVACIRTMGADVMGTPQYGRCPNTAIAVGQGIDWAPWIRGPCMVIREVIAAIVKMGTAKAAEIWAHLTAQIRRAANPWATVKGPLGALYMHLQEIG